MIAVLYDLLYIFPLSIVSVLAAGTYVYMPQKPYLPFGLMTVILAVCLCVTHWKSRMRFLIPFMLILSAGMTVLIHKADDRVRFVYESRWVLWIGLIVIGCFLAGKLILINRWGKRILAAVIMAALGVCMWQSIEPGKVIVALAFLPVLMTLTEEVQSRWDKSGYTDQIPHLVGVSPFLMLICILVFLSPSSDKPYDWKMFVQIWEKASEGIELTSRFFHSGDEDYRAKTGFDADDNLLESVSEDPKELLKMTSLKSSGNVVYLVGGVCDSFDGRGWSATHTPDSREHMLDVLEMVSAVSERDPDNISHYIRKSEVELGFLDFNTGFVFMPEKSVFSGNDIDGMELICEDGSFKSAKPLGYSSAYSVNFYRVNRGNEECRELLEHPVIPDESIWDEVRYNRVPESGYRRGEREIYDTSYETYLDYQRQIYDIYLPETHVSDKTTEYMADLLDGAESDYEKLTRIETMLGEMNYDLDPGKIPDNVITPADYLDHLLFDSQRGYCTHYATAFVLLARSQGIPARLVQGFYVNGWNGKEAIVTSSMAHSWAEAYISGIGWISFEPTPGKKIVDTWMVNTGAGGAYAGPSQNTSYKPELEKHEDEITEDEKPLITGERIGMILIPVGTFLLLLVLFILFEKLLEKRWYRKLSEKDKFRITGRRNIRILEFLGYVRGEGETLKELADRASATVDPQALRFINTYERMIYGEKDPIPDQIRNAELANRDLLQYLKEEKGKLFFLYRMMIMRPERIK